MAKQKGILPLAGTLDALNFYMRKGVPVVRKAGGGFTAKAIKKSPNMIRVRETSTEFGNASKIKKLFLKELFSFFGLQKDETLHSRMMQLFLKIKDCDITSARGKRLCGIGLQTNEGKRLLASFEFTQFQLRLSNSVYDSSNDIYSVSELDVRELTFPNNATHIELRLDVVFFDTVAMKTTRFSSEVLSISKLAPLSDFSLSPTEIPTGSGIKIWVLSYQYVQEMNGTFYPLKEKTAYGLKVLDIADY